MPYTYRPGTSPEEIRKAVAAALAPENRRLIVTRAAERALASTEERFRAQYGADAPVGIVVDGQPRQALGDLDPDQGEVLFQGARASEALVWIHEQLVANSPRRTGRYAESHILLADGQPADPTNPPTAERYVFASTAPYARKIEGDGRPPLSPQAPRGVYQAVAVMAARRFGNSVAVGYGFESLALDYIAGEWGRGARQRLREQPLRNAAMRLERATRVPVIVVAMP